MSNQKFTPVRGPEASISSYPINDGYVYYATDSGKIFLDANGERLSMGGAGSAIYYADAVDVQGSDETYYPIPKETLENKNASLKQGDLIINSDGAFYKVMEISATEFLCIRLAVSGSNSGGDVAPRATMSIIPPETKNFINGTSAVISFKADSPIIDGEKLDTDLDVYWTLYEKSGNSLIQYDSSPVSIPVKAGEEMSFDFGPYLRESTMTTIEMYAMGVNCSASYKKQITVTTSKLSLEYTSTFSNATTYSSDKVVLQCNVIGDIDKIVKFWFDGNLLESRPLGAKAETLQTLPIDPSLAPHGYHTVKIELYQSINGREGLSVSPLEYELAVTGMSDKPIIWLGNYQKLYYNYDSIQIPFLVYDPENTTETVVHLYKNNIELDGSPRTIKEFDEFNIFEIADADLNLINYYQISCGEGNKKVEREIEFTVAQDPNRKMEVVKSDYLKLNFDAKGRSNSESVTNRQKWESPNGSIKASFNNFNWYNNGWLMDENKNAYLRISNGASLSFPIGPMTFASNSSSEQSNSIEFQFKVRNIQDYSNLIKNITRYQEDEDFYKAFREQTKYTNYDAFLQWYLNNTEGVKVSYDDLKFDRVQKEISLDKAVCSYYSGDETSVVGLCLGSQDAFFSNGVNTVNVSYVENDMINLSMVYYHALKLMYIYINGVVTGVIKSTLTDPFKIDTNNLIFNSEYCDIDLYKVRIYNTDLNVNDIVTNYAVDYKSVLIYDQNKLAEENNIIKEYQFSYQNMIKYNEEHPTAPLMPYIIFDTSKSGTDILPWSKAVSIPVDVTFVNTGLERAYASGELVRLAIEDGLCTENSTAEQKAEAVKKYYKHHCPSWTGNNIEMVVQGTSSEFYPRRNYKIKTKTEYDSDEKERVHIFLNKGPYAAEYNEDQNGLAEGTVKLGDEKSRQKFWYMNNYTNGTHKWTMKVDYMESSGSYNAGFAGMVGNAYSKHPLKDYLDKGVIDPTDKDDEGNLIPDGRNLLYSEVTNQMRWSDYRTSLLGFPVLAFHKKSDGSYLFIGTYRMLLDKGSDEVLGFKPDKKVTNKLLGDKAVRKKAECWEFCNNARGFCSYRDPWERVELSFAAPQSAINDKTGLTAKGAPIITDHIEYRYNDNEDFIDILLDLDGLKPEDNAKIIKEFGEEYDVLSDKTKGYELIYDFYKNWERVNKWVWSTCIENVVSQGKYERVYTGINTYEPNKYYVMNDEGSGYVLCADEEWTEGQIYFTQEHMKDEDGNELFEDEDKTIPIYTYINAYVTKEEYLYAPNKYYEKVGENDFVLSAEAFDASLEYYELIETEDYKTQSDLLVKKCDEETYDPNKTYYTYDGSVKIGTRAVVAVDAETAQANYAPGKYYIPNPVRYGTRTYTHDTKEYRSDKFVNELNKHFDPEYMATYFIMTEVFECYDSRGKNCMMASWGPLEEGGDYVWYPIFYDIDTQLGINNTGIPSFEFNVDATIAGNFSTSDSILWNNFYKFFRRSYILMKYKHLKGSTEGVTWNKLANPPLSSVQDIENWYRFDPVETNSIMARGERPLIAINLDEYYKYITITNNLGVSTGITGYLDRNGKYTHDSNGTYFYALQGDRSQSRRQFLTNRLEYIDSWLNQGNYQRGGVNCIRGRVSANNAEETSDKWVETNTDTSATGGSYYLENGAKRNEFDAQYWLDLTPIRSSYITVSDDSAAYPSEKYDGINTVKFDVTAIESGVRKSPNYPEQLLYIYGMNQMADVGDMSNLYWREFYIDGEAPKLTRLKIGHDGLDKDGNKWFNRKMNLPSIPGSKESTGMPLLKEVNFCNINISTGSPSLDLTSCEKLEDFRATGSNFADILFAEGVALNTLYLPSSINRLALTEANLLTNLITEYETPVEINHKLTANPGLYIEGLFDDANLQLHTINLQGGALGYDSYKLLAQYYSKKSSGKITMTKVNWCPYVQLVEGDNYDLQDSELYYIDDGHYGFAEYEYDPDRFNIQVLSGEIYKKSNISDDIINQIDDSGLNMLKVFMNNDNFKSATNDAVPNITGIIYINNATQVDEGYIRNTLQEAYPGLKFFFADVNPAYSAKFVIVDDETGAYNYVPFADGSTSMPSVQKISKEQYAAGKTWFDSPYDLYKKEIKTHWDFQGWSTTADGLNIIKEEEWASHSINPDNVDYTFYAIFKLHEYDFNFYNDKDGTGENLELLKTISVPYGSPVNMVELNKLFPWKDDSDLSLTSTYGFEGYSLTETGDVVNMATYISRKNQNFYAQFKEISVYDNVLNPAYLNIEQNGALSFNADDYPKTTLKGKITLPIEVKGIKVKSIADSGFSQMANITHIFWEDKSALQLEEVKYQAFYRCDKLKYLEMPTNKDVMIASYAFNRCEKFFENIEQEYADAFFKNITIIQGSAFLKNSFENVVINLSEKLTWLGSQSFSEIDATTVVFGSSGKPSMLTSVEGSIFSKSKVTSITVYTDNLSKEIWNQLEDNIGIGASVQKVSA